MSMVSNGGSDVNINGVSFHLPSGFDESESLDDDSSLEGENYIFRNNEDHQYIKIGVYNSEKDKSVVYDSLSRRGFSQETINGKDGYGKLSYGLRYGYCYIDNDKYVVMDVPYVYAEKEMQHDDLLSYLIKWGLKNEWWYSK